MRSGVLFTALLWMLTPGILVSAESANEQIRRMDELMYPDARTQITLIFKEQDGSEEVYRMKAYAKDANQKVIVRFTAPPSQIGNDLIMLERNVWAYDQRAGRVMRVPSNQSFGGTGFSYGDVVRLNLADNYEAFLLEENGEQRLFDLRAKERDAPYFRIELTVNKTGYFPLRAVCYSRSNRVIKTMEYSGLKQVNGIVKPTRITVTSPYEPGESSVMIMESEELKSYPDRIFNKRNLAMRQEENF